MNFNDNGTIALPILGKTYTLKVPTIAQIVEFESLYDSLRTDALNQIGEWNERLQSADEDESEKIREQMNDKNFGLEAINEPWLRKVYETLGSSPLPDDLTDAPADILSPTLIPGILRHWRSDPLARSQRRQGRAPSLG